MPELAIVYICLESHLCSLNKWLQCNTFTYDGKGRRPENHPLAGPVLHSGRWDKTAARCPIHAGFGTLVLVLSQQHPGFECRVPGIGFAIGHDQ